MSSSSDLDTDDEPEDAQLVGADAENAEVVWLPSKARLKLEARARASRQSRGGGAKPPPIEVSAAVTAAPLSMNPDVEDADGPMALGVLSREAMDAAGILDVVLALPSSSSSSGSASEGTASDSEVETCGSMFSSAGSRDSRREAAADASPPQGGREQCAGALPKNSAATNVVGGMASWLRRRESRGGPQRGEGRRPKGQGAATGASESGSLLNLRTATESAPGTDSRPTGSGEGNGNVPGRVQVQVCLSWQLEVRVASPLFQAFFGPLECGSPFAEAIQNAEAFINRVSSCAKKIVQGKKELPLMKKFGSLLVKGSIIGLTYATVVVVLFPEIQGGPATTFEQELRNGLYSIILLLLAPEEDPKKEARRTWRRRQRQRRKAPRCLPQQRQRLSDVGSEGGEACIGAEEEDDPDFASESIPSIGTLHHGRGNCEPCAAFKWGRCARGATCALCHAQAHVTSKMSL